MSGSSGLIRRLSRTITPPLLVFAFIAGALYLADIMPGYIQRPPVQSFASVQEAQRAAGFTIALPHYFPDHFSWPPARVEITRRPYWGSSLGFTAQDSTNESLWIYQIAAGGSGIEKAAPLPKYITQMQTLPINDIMTTLVVGTSEAGTTVYQIRWNADGYGFVIVTSYSLDELIRISTSMVH